MKIVSFIISISLIFSSIPAKAWACAVSLCPMTHSSTVKGDDLSDLPPCHQKMIREKRAAAEKSANGQSISDNCPCPEQYLKSAIIPSSTIELTKLKKGFHSKHFDSAVKLSKLQRLKFQFLRPPPGNPQSRWRAHLQIYII